MQIFYNGWLLSFNHDLLYVLQKLESLMHVLMQVHVQSDPAGRLIVTGEPEQLDNPWGVTPFKKVCELFELYPDGCFSLLMIYSLLKLVHPLQVISLPSRIDPHQTSAVVTLHGQLLVRAPFEQSK